MQNMGSKPRDAGNHGMFCISILASGGRACANKNRNGTQQARRQNTEKAATHASLGDRTPRVAGLTVTVNGRERTPSPLGLVTKNLHNNMHAQTQKRREAILAKLLSVRMRRGEGGKTENEGPP